MCTITMTGASAYVARRIRAAQLARSFWTKACKYDSINVFSMFVVFTANNPYAAALNRARALTYGGVQ